jgi:hypothetical protein
MQGHKSLLQSVSSTQEEFGLRLGLHGTQSPALSDPQRQLYCCSLGSFEDPFISVKLQVYSGQDPCQGPQLAGVLW